MKCILIMAGVFFALSANAPPQQDYDQVTVRAEPVAKGLCMLAGAGGNIGLFAGEDGVFMIDGRFAPLTPRIVAVVNDLAGS